MRPVLLVGLLGIGGGCAGLDAKMDQFTSRAVATPEPSAGSRSLSARVDMIGAELVAQTPFLGVSPTFAVVGRPEPEIYHPDLNGVLVSEGLAARCSDDQLAAILALELGKMSVEARRARQYAKPEPLAHNPSGGSAMPGGSADPNQLTVQAILDKPSQAAARRARPAAGDPKAIAREVLQNSGRDASHVDAAAQMYDEATRDTAPGGRIGNRPKPPVWTN